MEIRTSFSQAQNQSLTISPELQQSLKILQFNYLELSELIKKELLENPTLQNEKEAPPSEEKDVTHGEIAAQIETPRSVMSSGDFDPDSTAREIRAREHTPKESLLLQLKDCDHTLSIKKLTAFLIGNLDERGFLDISEDEIRSETSASSEEIESAITLLQSLDPAGIGARNTSDCLLLQLKRIGKENSLEARLLQTYSSLSQINISAIALKEGVTLNAIREAFDVIRSLELSPLAALEEAPPATEPDLSVRKSGDDYVISLNDDEFSALRVDDSYKELVKDKKALDKKSRHYLKNKLSTASWFIRCIRQRKETLLKVASAIVHHERDFLEKGIDYLAPLTLKQIADEVGVHESTVSRAVANKLIETPRGVFELKYFFTPKIKTSSGDISVSTVKAQIEKFIVEESHPAPLSDGDLTRMLKGSKIIIARRTVAKYRELLGIGNAEARKQQYALSAA